MASDTTKQTQAVFDHHMQAISQGMDALLSDYAEDAVLFTPDGVVRGLAGLRAVFEGMMSNMPPGALEAFQVVRQDVDGDVAYILYKAEPFLPMATDTFVVRNGKIVAQTMASYMPS